MIELDARMTTLFQLLVPCGDGFDALQNICAANMGTDDEERIFSAVYGLLGMQGRVGEFLCSLVDSELAVGGGKNRVLNYHRNDGDKDRARAHSDLSVPGRSIANSERGSDNGNDSHSGSSEVAASKNDENEKDEDERENFTVLRGNSLSTRLTSFVLRENEEAQEYLGSLITPLVRRMEFVQSMVEVNPTHLGGNEALAMQHRSVLERCIKAFLNDVFKSAPRIPSLLADLLGHVRRRVSSLYPGREQALLGSVLFLRFICPAVAVPEEYGFVETQPNKAVRRGLILISKITQTLVSGQDLRESYLVYFNELIEVHRESIASFLRLASDPQFDPDVAQKIFKEASVKQQLVIRSRATTEVAVAAAAAPPRVGAHSDGVNALDLAAVGGLPPPAVQPLMTPSSIAPPPMPAPPLGAAGAPPPPLPGALPPPPATASLPPPIAAIPSPSMLPTPAHSPGMRRRPLSALSAAPLPPPVAPVADAPSSLSSVPTPPPLDGAAASTSSSSSSETLTSASDSTVASSSSQLSSSPASLSSPAAMVRNGRTPASTSRSMPRVSAPSEDLVHHGAGRTMIPRAAVPLVLLLLEALMTLDYRALVPVSMQQNDTTVALARFTFFAIPELLEPLRDVKQKTTVIQGNPIGQRKKRK
jgi:GTPase-activator protein for Ras-like GTPase